MSIQVDRHIYRKEAKQIDRQTTRQPDIQTDKQTNKHTNNQTDRQTDRQKDRPEAASNAVCIGHPMHYLGCLTGGPEPRII